MSEYRLFRTTEFEKSFSKIDKPIKQRLEKKLKSLVYEQIKTEPHFGKNIKKLRDYDPDTWRYRIGDYRLFYIIDEDEMVVALLSIDDRKSAYR